VNSLRVKTNYLVEGCIINEDILGLTQHPIMTKKTILSEELIGVLNAFLISEVSVEKTLINGQPFIPPEVVVDDETEEITEESTFLSLYLKAVQTYKKNFKNWQAGSKIEVGIIREFMILLFEKSMVNPIEIFSLHHYANKEDYLYHHAVSMGLLSGYVAQKMKYELADVYQIVMAGSLADCGMAKISSAILEKKTSLTASEYEEIRKHPIYSLQMLQDSAILKETVKYAIFEHHERLDGSGYPAGGKGKTLHSFSQIVAVVDVYHAMTSERMYRNKQSPFKVMEMIMQDEFGKFDIAVVRTLLNGIMNFSIGSKVRLTNGYIAEIIFIESRAQTRPLVKVLDSNEMIDLNKVRDLFIEEIL
jgi:HD-GYP domain-containing protein (c-di-GMP phosphodiesterase class II)